MTDTLSMEQLLNLLPDAHGWALTSAARAELPDGHRLHVDGTRVHHYSARTVELPGGGVANVHVGLYEYRPATRVLIATGSGEYVDRPAKWAQLVDGRDGPTADTLQELIEGVLA